MRVVDASSYVIKQMTRAIVINHERNDLVSPNSQYHLIGHVVIHEMNGREWVLRDTKERNE